MLDENGKPMRHAGPSTPVEILGLSDVPQAGDRFAVAPDEKTARAWAQEQVTVRQVGAGAEATRGPLTLESLQTMVQAGTVKDLNVIVKTDVQGSIEPIKSSLEKLSNDEVRVRVLHAGTGNVSDNDVNLAQTSGAIIVAFNVRVEPSARRMADNAGVDIRHYSVIYEVVEDVEAALRGMLEPKYQEVLEGRVEVRQLFRIGRTTVIAGSFVLEGRITRQSILKVLRGNRVLLEGGRIAGLKRMKDDVREVQAGYECGITVEDFNDFQPGDIIEAYARERVE
jgi:translation initiation factor IF-2